MIKHINAHNELVEKQLIAYMFLKEEFVDIPEDLLYKDNCKKVYNTWKKQYLLKGSFNSLLVPEELSGYVSECCELAFPEKYDSIIKDLRLFYNVRTVYKKIIGELGSISDDYSNIKNIMNNISGSITELLMESEESQKYNHGVSVLDFVEEVHDAVKSDKSIRGYATHLPELDIKISGFERGKVYLVSGLEKLGKSRFVRNLFSKWLSEKLGCCMFLLEEDPQSIHECILAERAIVDTSLIGTNNLNSQSLKRIRNASMSYMNEPLYISNKSGINTQYVKSTIQKQKIKMKSEGHELIFCVIDYVQRMSDSGDGQHEQTQNIASELANIARDENVCMIEISQMGSGAEKNKNVPLHTQIRFGKVFKEAAHCIITFDDPARRNNEDPVPDAKSKLIIANIIQRKGESNINIPLVAQLQYSSFACQAV